MPTRVTLLMQIATAPPDRSVASPHIGGWSESWWQNGTYSGPQLIGADLAKARAALLPAEGSVIGYRLSTYTLSLNKIFPGGSSTGKLQLPGSALRSTDLPQVALQLSGSAAGQPNTSQFTLRGMPDDIMLFGEYQPTPNFKAALTRFRTDLVAEGYNFLGRDLSFQAARILSVTGSTVTLSGAISTISGQYVRFLRCYDDNGDAIKGAYVVQDTVSPGVYTLRGFSPRTLTVPNGTMRPDFIRLLPFANIEVSRAVVKKVGRPFEQYRGRASKRRA